MDGEGVAGALVVWGCWCVFGACMWRLMGRCVGERGCAKGWVCAHVCLCVFVCGGVGGRLLLWGWLVFGVCARVRELVGVDGYFFWGGVEGEGVRKYGCVRACGRVCGCMSVRRVRACVRVCGRNYVVKVFLLSLPLSYENPHLSCRIW